MTRRLTLTLLALLAVSGGFRLIAQDVVLIPGTISGSISVANTVIKQATVYASPSTGGSTSSMTVTPNAASATYSLTVSVPPSGPATFNAFADIYTDEYRDYLRTTTSQVSVSASTPGQLNFNPAVGFINASVTVSGGTLSSAYVYASQIGSYAQTNTTSQYGWTFPTMPGNSINLGGTAYLTDGRQINFPNQTVSVASGETRNVSFSVTAPTNAIGGTIDFTGPKTVTYISAFASGPTYRSISQQPPPANHAYLLDGLGTGQYTVGVYAYTNNNQAYLYMPDSAFSPSRTVTVGQSPVTVNVSAPQAFINSTLTLTGAPTISPYLSFGYIQYTGQSQTAAAGGSSFGQMNATAKTFESVVAPGTWRQGNVYLSFYRSAAPWLSAGLQVYDLRASSNVTLAAGETRTPAIDLALGEVTLTMSVAGGGTLSNPRLQSAYCTHTVGGATLWQFYPSASTGVSNVTQGQVTFVGPAGTCTVTPAMTVNGSSVALSPITVTIVPGTSQVIDVGGPTLTMTSPAAEAIVVTPSVMVSGKATDDVGVDSVKVNGVGVTLTSTANPSDGKEVQFQTTVSGLQRGPNTITTVASDATAKNATDARTVYYDTAAPSLAFTPADGTITQATTTTVSGTADDDAGVSRITVNGALVSFSSTNNAAKPKEVSFATSVPLVAGPNPITVRVTDISTRTAILTHTVTRETQKATSLSVASVSAPFNGTATLSATLTSNGAGVAGKIVRFNYGAGGQNLDVVTNDQGVASRSGVSVTGYGGGTVNPINASFGGDGSHSASAGSGQLTITKASAAISLTGGTFTYDGLAKTATASTTPANLTGLVVKYSQNGVATGTPTNAGIYAVSATLVNPDYEAPAASAQIVIDKARPQIAWAPPAPMSTFVYDGQPHAAMATATGIAGEPLTPLTTTYRGGSADPGATIQFAPAASYGVGDFPFGNPAIADFNGDGKVDVAIPNYTSGTISSLMGDGAGGFTPGSTSSVGTQPVSVTAADFNRDGRVDLAVSMNTLSRVTILLGNGDGTFRSGAVLQGVYVQNVIRAIDLNRDGKQDLVSVGNINGAVIYLGNGDGTFQPMVQLGPVNRDALGVTAGDVNGDGIIDIAVANRGANNNVSDIALLLGRNDGTYAAPVLFSETSAYSVGLPDLNGDGKLDLVVANQGGPMSIRLGLGNGTFGARTTIASYAMWFAAGDVNGDGRQDLVTATQSAQGFNNLAVLLGRGDGTFEPEVLFATPSNLWGVALADLDGNGALDIVATGSGNDAIVVRLQQSSGAAGSQTPPTDAGPYTVTATYAGSDNYAAASAQTTLTITKAPLTVTADDKRRTHGEANLPFTATITGFVTGQSQANLAGTLTFTTTATQASSAGAYAITPGGLTSTNYAIGFVGGVLTIDKAALVVRADNKSRLYGAANPTFTATYSGFVLGQGPGVLGGTLAFATPATDASDVGTYPITPAGVTSDNYAITFVDALLTIDKAALVVRADNKSRLYGAANPTLTATYSGLVLGQGAGVLGGTLAFATPATDASDVGTYAITPGGLTAGNYAVTFVDGALTIEKAPLTVRADNKSRLYGAANPAFSVSCSGFELGQGPSVLGGTLAFATPAIDASDVGTYPITPSGLTSGNYAIAFADGVLTIERAPLTVRADSKSRLYGAPNPAFDVIYEGLVAGDTAAALQGTLGITTAADERSSVGAYPIHPAGLSSPNYDIAFVDGTLTITQAEAHLAVAPAGPFTYDAAPHGTTASARGVFGEDLGPVSLTYDGSSAVPVAAGSYAVQASYEGSLNYAAGTTTGTIVINRAPLDVTANDLSRQYGQPNPTFTATFAGFVGGETLNVLRGVPLFATPATQSSGAGTYAVASSGVTSPNYDIRYHDGVLTVLPAPLVVTANDAVREFGTPNPAFSAAFTGFVLGETAAVLSGALSLTTPAGLESAVGSYPVVPAGVSSSNYQVEFRAGTLRIVDTTPPDITLVTPSQTALWPPNHQLIPVTLAVDAHDAASSFTCRISNVSSSEPDNGLGDGDTTGDTEIIGATSVSLRAERAGKGPGRIYTIQVECRDAFGNTSRDTASVSVPKSQGK